MSYDLGFIDLEQKLCSHIVNVYFLELRNGDIYVGSTNNLPRILNPVLEKPLRSGFWVIGVFGPNTWVTYRS
jgi:hypothetical protein